MSTYALVCASRFARDDFAARYAAGEFDCVVAVDSGLRHLDALDVAPDVVLGDFDSLGYVPKGAEVHPAIKDKSDLELALDYCESKGATDLVVYGCLGGRLDHTLAALQNLAAVAEGGKCSRVRAIDVSEGDRGDANARMPRPVVLEVMVGPATLSLNASLEAKAEDVPALGAPTYGSISIFASTSEAKGVTERGMFYPLDHALLSNRTSLGLSNELIESRGEIAVECGTIYALYPADLVAKRS